MGALDNFAFVLLKPKSAGNAGAAARALKNMGFRDLRLVAPPRWNPRSAATMAVHGDDILAAAQIHPDLASAIADRTLVVGTTARIRLYRSESRAVRDAAPSLIAESAANRIAVVFGPEDFGLTNQELKFCQRLVTIPTAPEYASLNLAQAVMIVAYELMLAAGAARELGGGVEYAPAAAVDAMFERMAQALVAVGFLPADNPAHIMFTLRAIFGRSGIKPRELEILNGIASQIRWFAQGGHETAAAKQRAGKKLR
jgi:TrmH family RNA methyltransferase